MKKMLLIVNPYAGVRKITRCLTDVIGIFNRAGYEVVTHITAGRDDATQQALQWADKVDMIVCAGGDGTYNETVTGILRSGHDTCVGYIPCGSTNDLAASLNLSTNILTASREIVEGEPTPFDVGQFGDRYFSYIASFGAFTKASYATSQDMKNTLGHTAYLLEGIQELSQIRKVHARIQTENKVIEDDFIFVEFIELSMHLIWHLRVKDIHQINLDKRWLKPLRNVRQIHLVQVARCRIHHNEYTDKP